jgi:hypothetical protein
MSDRCEETLAALATGGWIRRSRARLHAARCPRCASARDDLRRIAGALAEIAPLGADQRMLWADAPGANPADPGRSRRPRPALAAAAAVLIVGALAAWWASRPVDRRQDAREIAHVPPPALGTEVRDEADLGARAAALMQELDDLRRLADLLDARRDADALLARLAPKGESRGSGADGPR